MLPLRAETFFDRTAHGSEFGLYSAACDCGLQNAMMSTFSGAVVRTTHISGMFTDLGIFLGHAIRGLPVDLQRIRLCFLIITGTLTAAASLAYGLCFMRRAR